MGTFSTLLSFCGGFHSQKSNDIQLWCSLWSYPEQAVQQTVELPVIWDAMALMGRHWNGRFEAVMQKAAADQPQWPLLLTWINFNPSMDK